MSITPRQQQLLDFIISYKQDHDGCAPTTREIVAALGLSTTSAVAHLLGALERAGAIRTGLKGQARMITVTGAKWTPPQGWA